MHRAQEAETSSEAWEDAYSQLLRKARKLKEALRIAREQIAIFERDSEADERYIRLQKDIVSEKVNECNRLLAKEQNAYLLQQERDRALRTLDALTNDHAYEADHLTLNREMHRIPLENRVRIGNWLELACLEARAASGDAQAQAALLAAVRPADREG